MEHIHATIKDTHIIILQDFLEKAKITPPSLKNYIDDGIPNSKSGLLVLQNIKTTIDFYTTLVKELVKSGDNLEEFLGNYRKYFRVTRVREAIKEDSSLSKIVGTLEELYDYVDEKIENVDLSAGAVEDVLDDNMEELSGIFAEEEEDDENATKADTHRKNKQKKSEEIKLTAAQRVVAFHKSETDAKRRGDKPSNRRW